jgi:hypothetical protein
VSTGKVVDQVGNSEWRDWHMRWRELADRLPTDAEIVRKASVPSRRRCAPPARSSPWPPSERPTSSRPSTRSELPEWKEDLNSLHRTVRARVEHTLARMKCWKILRDYRRAASTLSDAVSESPTSITSH